MNLDRLAATSLQVAALTRPQRIERVHELIEEAHQLLELGVEQHIEDEGKDLAGVVVLYSGGNDSTVLAHLMRHRASHAAHANTGVGIEETREFVRETCRSWDLPLVEKRAPRVDDSYRAMVLDQGFPGPGHHFKMFQRLKERALRQIRNEVLNGRSRTHRVVFLAGRRRMESNRRANIPELERDGSIVWISPLVNWTKLDLNTYRVLAGDVPRNRVSDMVHMSGECLCGSFAKEGERDEISHWFPSAFAEIAELERILAGPDYAHIKEHQRTWGWGWDPEVLKASRHTTKAKVGRLCSSCVSPHDGEVHVV